MPPAGRSHKNLMVVEDNGRIWSRQVSQLFGRSLLGAMVLPVDFAPLIELHGSFLPLHKSLTLDNIRNAAQAIAPRDNFMFIDDSRKILSCRIDPDNGVALLENLEENPEEDTKVQPVLSQAAITQAREHKDMLTEPSQNASEAYYQQHGNASSSSSPPLATSAPPANTPAILSDQVLSTVNRQPYDRDWMTKHSISEAHLHGCPRRPKLDVLLRHGAIKAGDKLCVTYHHNSQPVIKVGEVLQTPKMARLDLRIAPAGEYSDGILHGCQGPKDILRGMDEAFGHLQRSQTPETWKAVRVVAGDGREVGSLWTVRRTYGVFTEMMAEWGERNRRVGK